MNIILSAYRGLTSLSAPVLNRLLQQRLGKGKEDPQRYREKRGETTMSRPPGPVLWCHGASVGEALSILPLIQALLERNPQLTILVTTTTVTSAKLMATRLPDRAIHQYAPLDHPRWVRTFLDHWRPDAALWLESELWPNMLGHIQARGVPAVLVNGRISDRSFKTWQHFRGTAGALLGCFRLCLGQSAQDMERLSALGAKTVDGVGNIKFAAPPLPVDEDTRQTFSAALDGRPVWLAASTHPGEEALILDCHRSLSAAWPNLLTIITPRHPDRRDELAALLDDVGIPWSQRSAGHVPSQEDGIYLADTLGEMGLLFATTPLVFMGGSLVPIGGHNPIEPAHFGCVILHGPHMENFRAIREQGRALKAMIAISDVD
ncbi:MAG: 3-deoxy-D-manno-octulosonic acid transferase, partial [Pseudomonadota bacterium]